MSDPSGSDVTREIGTSDGWVADESAGPQRGQSVGRYLVVDRLGAGGMGEVVAAYDPELDRRVALKIVSVRGGRRARAHERMLREAQALAKLSHPNVVAVYDAGTYEANGQRRVFIAMEHIEGQTLQAWLDAEPRDWREIVGAMLAAGRGLAAAHDVGLVHRDFKPSNVMVGRDGRVRVLDFGLARRFDDLSIDADAELDVQASGDLARSADLSASLTETGIVMGTPAFMAPEQFFRGTIDARTDQFSFCVVLYRALFGVAPFAGRTFAEIGRAVEQGRLLDPPKSTAVPRSIRDALTRGLATAAGDRFATMNDLLAALARALRGTRRRALALALGMGTIAVASSIGWVASQRPRPCLDLDTQLRGVWDDDRRQGVADAFASTGAVFAPDARDEVVRILDRYTDAWLAMRVQTCEATRVHGDQTEGLMDLRNACLDGRRRALQALGDVLVRADAKVVERAVDAAGRLPSIDPCADTEQLLADVRPPSDPLVAAAVAALRDELAGIEAEVFAGRFDRERAQSLLARATEIGYLPLVAEGGILLGRIEEYRGDGKRSERAFEDALVAAASSGHTHAEADALLGLASVASTHTTDLESALRFVRHARAILVRLGEPPEKIAYAWLYTGNAYFRAHQWDQAEHAYENARAVAAGIANGTRLQLAALSNLASAQGSRGNYRAAIEATDDALALALDTLGPHHPMVGNLHGNLGASHARFGNSADAVQELQTALAIYDETIGSLHPETARAYHNFGFALLSQGDYDRALSKLERALAIKREALGPDDVSVVSTETNIADTLRRLGRPEEGRAYADHALRIVADQLGNDHPDTFHPRFALAEIELALGRPHDARRELGRAIDVAERTSMDPYERALLDFCAARIEHALGERPHAAIDLARRARTELAAVDRDARQPLAEIDTWLRAHAR